MTREQTVARLKELIESLANAPQAEVKAINAKILMYSRKLGNI